MKWFEKVSGKYPRKTHFYHASPHRMPVGTVVRPARNLPQIKPQYNSKDFVYLTVDPKPHYTIAGDIMSDDYAWHVYEVVPEGKIWPGEWNDIRAERAVVVRYVGNAKGLYLHDKQKRKEQTERRNERGKELNWSDPNFPKETGPAPGTSTVNYRKVNPRGPYKVKGRQWVQPFPFGPSKYDREYRNEQKVREEMIRRMYEKGLSLKREGDPEWYAKIIELFALGKRDDALRLIKDHVWGTLKAISIQKELEERGEEIRRQLEL